LDHLNNDFIAIDHFALAFQMTQDVLQRMTTNRGIGEYTADETVSAPFAMSDYFTTSKIFDGKAQMAVTFVGFK